MQSKSTHRHLIDACVSKSSGPRCEIVGRVSRRLSVLLSSCTHGFCVAPAPLQHCYAARAKKCYCHHVQTSWESLLLMVFAQAFSVHGQIVCLTCTLPLQIQTCRATRESVAKRPPGTTGVGLLLPSNTPRTATLVEVSGPPVVTSPIMKIGLVNWRSTRPVVRRKKMRESPMLWLWQRSRLSRTATRNMDESLRTAQPTLRPRTPPGTLRRQRLRRKKLQGQGWVNSIVC